MSVIKFKHFAFIITSCISALLAISSSFAAPQESVLIEIRAIKATNVSGAERVSLAASERELESPAMSDLKKKLKKLKYNHFSLVSKQEREVQLNSRDTITLADGNVLSFRPISKDKDKICIWLNWKDGKGMNVLDTRLHFADGETMITGMDSDPSTGLVLAIDVK